MSSFRDAPASAIAGEGSFLSKFNLSGLSGRIVSGFTTWRNRRMVVNMRDFDDAQLADIGLTRADVEKALSASARTDPTLHLIHARQDVLKGVRHS